MEPKPVVIRPASPEDEIGSASCRERVLSHV